MTKFYDCIQLAFFGNKLFWVDSPMGQPKTQAGTYRAICEPDIGKLLTGRT